MYVELMIADGRSEFYQWDTDQLLITDGLSIGSKLHFDMPNTDVPISMSVYEINGESVCRVPDELLQSSGSFKVWAYVTDELGSRTVYQKTFKVKSREKPPGYVYTETEQKLFSDLQEQIDDLDEQLTDVVNDRVKCITNGAGTDCIEGGSTDVDMYRSLTGKETSLSPASADGLASVAFGANASTLSVGDIAAGVDVVAGCRGYYHNGEITLDDANYTYSIKLYTDYNSKKPATSIPWIAGDIVSINNGNAHPLCGEVITSQNNTLYVHPLSTITILTGSDLAKEKAGRKPDDLSICVPSKPESGEVNLGFFAMARGCGCKATGTLSTAIGQDNLALDKASFITGRQNVGSFAALVGGYKNTVLGPSAFAVGRNNIVSNINGAATGELNKVSGFCAKADGYNNEAIGGESEAGGRDTKAIGAFSRTLGRGTIADADHQVVHGRYNVRDTEKQYLHIVGNGDADNKRSNAYTLDTNGNAWFRGSIFVGGENQNGATELSMDNIVNETINALPMDNIVNETINALPMDNIVNETINALPMDNIISAVLEAIPQAVALPKSEEVAL